MTNHWVDIKNTDLVLIMGGNAAEAHPCGFKWVTEAKTRRKAKLVVVDPRFTRSAAVSDYYAPLRVGSDIAFLNALMHVLIAEDLYDRKFVGSCTIDFDKLEENVRAYPPERAADICGIAPETIRDVARRIAGFTPALPVIWPWARAHN